MTAVEVTPLGRSRQELADAAAVAARAFHFDPFFIYLCGNPLLRARGLSLFCRSVLAGFGDAGALYGARQPDGRLVGVAGWLRPGRYPLPVPTQLRQAAGALWALFPRPRALIDGTKYLVATDKVHPREPIWYLSLLVVDPSVQRSGIGTLLQGDGLAAADADGLDCYLETQNRDNLAYYARFGYEQVEELRPVRGGPPLYTMRRRSRPSAR